MRTNINCPQQNFCIATKTTNFRKPWNLTNGLANCECYNAYRKKQKDSEELNLLIEDYFQQI
ncbi:unknown protein [Microcystis aeruginosa NIES-843]|uniref:Uncharacterized protein n=1 Tax=Microcystis aeruginosa (strain NIES-843 / IAM M-2473) TaxID=449447 RepID=B0JKA6_MICAN|nr:unknown protein [Microcystis aeruginosa NIES-843]